MMIEPIWWQYAIFEKEDDGGAHLVGLKDDAPEEVKKEYEEYLKLKESGIKL